MTMEMYAAMKKRESLASAVTLRIRLSRLRKPQGDRLLGPRLHFHLREASRTLLHWQSGDACGGS